MTSINQLRKYYRVDYPWNFLNKFVENYCEDGTVDFMFWVLKRGSADITDCYPKRMFITVNEAKALCVELDVIEIHVAYQGGRRPFTIDIDYSTSYGAWMVWQICTGKKHMILALEYAIDYIMEFIKIHLPDAEVDIFYSGGRGIHLVIYGSQRCTMMYLKRLQRDVDNRAMLEMWKRCWLTLILPNLKTSDIRNLLGSIDSGRHLNKWLDDYGENYSADNWNGIEYMLQNWENFGYSSQDLDEFMYVIGRESTPDFDWAVTTTKRHLSRAPLSYHRGADSFKIPFRTKDSLLNWLNEENLNEEEFIFPSVSFRYVDQLLNE